MAIEIIDGFKVSSAVPVDNRIVASGSNARSAIAYKYEGLRVFDTYDSTPYVWLSNTWKKESQNSLSATVTLGFESNSIYRVGQILKVYDSAKTLTNSNIFEKLTLNAQGGVTNRAIAINHIDAGGSNTPNTVSNTVQLDVNGSIKAISFEGNGANITDISPLYFNTGTNKIQINQIEPGDNGYFLGNEAGALKWLDLSAGFSPTSLTATVETNSPIVEYLIFINNSGNVHKRFANNNLIGVIPSTGQIVVKNSIAVGGGVTSPPYSFIDDQDTGIYNSAAGSVGISSNGSKRVEIDTNGLKVFKGTANDPGISFIGANNYGIYQTTTGNNRIGIVVDSNEMIRIKSLGAQGNGNTAIYGEGGLLSLIGNTHAYMEFYRTGSANPNANAVITPSGSGRGAYIGYPSGSTDFEIKNTSLPTYISLLSTGIININSKINTSYGVDISNNGTTLAWGLKVTANFAPTDTIGHSRIIARYDTKVGGATYTSTYITSQGILLWGYSGVGTTQTSYSGTADKPSLAFNSSSSTGLYSDASNILGITTNGTKKIVINSTGVQMAAFESEDLEIPNFSHDNWNGDYGSSNYNNNNNIVPSPNTAYINAVKELSSSNSGQYTARWIRLGFKFKAYTKTTNTYAQQRVDFASKNCDRMFYCSVPDASYTPPSNFRGFQARFYIGGPGNGNYLGRFLSNTGASENIYNGSGSFYVPAGHIFSIVFEWYSNTFPINDFSGNGAYGMEVRAFRMGLS